MPMPIEKKYTANEFYSMDLPERCELINGEIVDMAPAPNISHQKISMRISTIIQNYIDKNKGKCEVFSAPTDVKLSDKTVLQPDIFVTCDPDKLDSQYHNGAPDWVIEITSPSTAVKDLSSKMVLYKAHGVREYWVIDTEEKRVIVYLFEEHNGIDLYTFADSIPVHIYKDAPEPLVIRLADFFDQ